jgi:glycosyltransferase involved in cell wall biosynthesis
LSAQLLADVPTSLTSFDPHLIVGHDRRTGGIALELRRLHFQNAKVCVIVHTAPHAIERHKIDRKDANEIASGSEQRRETLARIVDAADFRCAVGQRLEQSTKLVVTAPAISILVLTPGAHILDKPASSGEDRFILLFGRAEDAVLKGIELAHDVACKLKEKSPYGYSWTVRGVSEGTLAAFMTRYHSFNLPLCYTTDSELIDQGFARASLVLMPSLEEGFGLVALEAIGHNRPVLISQESGVAQYLKRICPEHASHFIVSTFSPTSHKKVIDNWVAAIERIYDNWATTTEKLGIIREKLKERGSWQNTKMDFISICFKNSHVQ